MDNRFIGLIMGLVVGVLLIGSLLVPTITDATTTEKTFTNVGFFRMTEISADDEETTTIEWDYETPYVFTINGVDVELPFGSTSGDIFPYTIFATDGWGIRFTATNYGNQVDLNMYGSGTSSGLLWYATTTDHDNLTITLSAGTASFSKNGGAATTYTYTNVFIPSNDGEYTLKKATETAYLNSDSLIYSTGRTSATFGSNTFALNINMSGNISDGETVSVIAPSGFSATNVVVNATEAEDYIDLYQFSSVTFDMVQESTSIEAGAVYSQVIVPYQVTAELADHLDAGEIAMIAVIPVLMIASLLIFAVRFVTRD